MPAQFVAESAPPTPVAAVVPEAAPLALPVQSSAADPAAILNAGREVEPSATGEGVYLQLGAFQNRENAEGFRGHVAAELDWLRERLSVLDHDGRYRLQAGPYVSAAVARAVAARIADALDVQAFLVSR